MIPVDISSDNFKFLCARYYAYLDVTSFTEDVNRVYIVRKMVKKYIKTDFTVINERLLLNHVIILFNGFGKFAVDMLYHIHDQQQIDRKYINSFMIYLNQLSDEQLVNGVDLQIITKLRQL